MALVAERWGLVAPLKEYSGSGKPLWGTCAGLIFLANRAVGELLLMLLRRERRRKLKTRVKFYYFFLADSVSFSTLTSSL